MTNNPMDFRTGTVAPMECLKEGWETIKDQYWLFLGLTVVTMLIGGAVPIVLVGPMMCGLYLCIFTRMRGEAVDFGLLFKGFDYFMQGLIAAAIQTLPVFVLVVIGDIFFFAFTFTVLPHTHGEPPPAIFWLGLVIFVLIMMIVSLIVHSVFMFSYPLIVDRKLSGWDAVKTSYRAALQNLGGVVGLILLNAGLSILGVLACYVGVFLVMPVSFASYAAAYRRVFPDIGNLNFAAPPPPPGSWAA
jgi:uncharacterized membrane protein